MKKTCARLGSTLLAAALMLSLTPAAFAIGVESKSPDGFVDLDPNAWYAQAAAYTLEHGILSGTGPDTFSPEDTLTRAMAVQMVYAMDGKPNMGSHTYGDVSHDAWYDDAVAWAASKNIMYGYQEGRFFPDDPITREQLSLILFNYAKLYHYNTLVRSDLSSFADGDTTSDWAKTSMSWAVASGLMSGREGNMLSPRSSASRAEIAQIMTNFCLNVIH